MRAPKISRSFAIRSGWTSRSACNMRAISRALRAAIGAARCAIAAPVRAIVLERFPATLELSLAALLVCVAIAIPAGVFSARRRGSRADRATSFFTLLGLSVPNFALGPDFDSGFFGGNRMAACLRDEAG